MFQKAPDAEAQARLVLPNLSNQGIPHERADDVSLRLAQADVLKRRMFRTGCAGCEVLRHSPPSRLAR